MIEEVLPQGRIEDLALGVRRDVRGMTALLTELEPGAHIAAVFRSNLYGQYRVAGTVTHSEALDTLVLAGQPLHTGTKPADNLVTLERLDDPQWAWQDSSRRHFAIADIGHGDLVAAHLRRKPYGSFTITGFAVATPPHCSLFTLGGWLLTHRQFRYVRTGIRALTRLSSPADHGAPVPAPITRWPETTPS